MLRVAASYHAIACWRGNTLLVAFACPTWQCQTRDAQSITAIDLLWNRPVVTSRIWRIISDAYGSNYVANAIIAIPVTINPAIIGRGTIL
jgi:hypothetical protein